MEYWQTIQAISYTLTLVAYSYGKWQGNYLTHSAGILGANFLVLSQHPFSAPRLRPCHIAPKSIRPIHLYHPFYHVYIYIYVPTKLGYVDTFWYYTQFVNCWLVDKLTSFLGYLIHKSHSPHHCKQLFNNDRVHPQFHLEYVNAFIQPCIFWAIKGWVLL